MNELYFRLCMIDKSCNTWDGRLTQELLPFCLQTLEPQDVFIRELTHPEISKSFSCIEMYYFHVLKYSHNLLTCKWVLLASSASRTAPQESGGGRRWTPGMWGPCPPASSSPWPPWWWPGHKTQWSPLPFYWLAPAYFWTCACQCLSLPWCTVYDNADIIKF